MAELNVEDLLQKFRATQIEGSTSFGDAERRKDGSVESSFVGKILTDKPVKSSFFKESIRKAWSKIGKVKQQKKSSNKWVCVVCNQRQSVLKIHARGPLAKDVRQFVQTFNISRMTHGSDGPRSVGAAFRSEVESCDTSIRGSPFSTIGVGGGHQSQRRTDWTEYLDPKLNGEEEEEEDDDGGRVTELPPSVFGHPFQKCPLSAPAENKISELKKRQDQAQQERIAKKKCCKAVVEERGSSRWSEYLKEEETDESLKGEGSYRDWRGNNFQTSELKVEEEVHPDFQ